MSTAEEFQPYINGAKRLLGADIDSHVDRMTPHIVYYGETPEGISTPNRLNKHAIEVQDDSGVTQYGVLMSGDLVTAKTILVKAMPWSDDPGRGFEALREALIADPDEHLAVVGVSFPGSGAGSGRMTSKQRESLKKDGADFSFIASQQWKAIESALLEELENKNLTPEEAEAKIRAYDFVLSGSSQGALNAIGLLQSAPENVRVASLGLAHEVGLEAVGWWRFRKNFITHGSEKFPQYTAENAYNQYPALGPSLSELGPIPIGLAKNVATRPASHLGSVIKAMRMGGDVQRIIDAVKQKDIKDLAVTIATGSHDALAPAEATDKAARLLNASRLIVAESIIWEGHYHPAMENLANAQQAFRSFAK